MKKILIIDDEGDLTEMLSLRLEHEGFQVEVANSGPAGIKKVKESKPDVVLLDVLMPEMDGWTVCKKLREDPKTNGIPIIIFTVLEKAKAERGAKNCGANRVIPKPFDKNALIQILKEEVGQ